MDGTTQRRRPRFALSSLLFFRSFLFFCVDTLRNGESCPPHFFRPVARGRRPVPSVPSRSFPDFRSIKYEELSRIYVDCLLHFSPSTSPPLFLLSFLPSPSSVQSSFCSVSCIFGQAQLTPNPAETDKELAGLEKPKEEREERRGAR